MVGVPAEVRETYLAKDSGLDAVKSQAAMERIRRRREERGGHSKFVGAN